jgi:AsmA-like protein
VWRLRRPLLAFFSGLAILLVAAGVLPFFLSGFLNSSLIREAVQKQTAPLGIDVDFERVHFHLLPTPQLILDRLSVAGPHGLAATVASIDVSPAVGALVHGRIAVNGLRLDHATVTLPLASESSSAPSEPSRAASPAQKRVLIAEVAAALASSAPDLYVEASDATVNLIRENTQPVVLQIERLDAHLMTVAQALHLSLNELVFGQSHVRLTADAIVADPPQDSQVAVTARNVQIQYAHDLVTALGLDHGAVQETFNVLRAGAVPEIGVASHGASLAELADNLVVRGALHDGELFVPGPDLYLSAVTGDARIEKGVLYGDHASAHTGNSSGKGSIKLQLVGHTTLLLLDLEVHADVADVPPVLRRVVDDPTFLHQLDLLTDVGGTAHGTLTLQELSEGLDTRVHVTDFTLSARQQTIGAALNLRGSRFEYAPSMVAFEGVSGTVGNTCTYDRLAARIRWKEVPSFEVFSGSGTLGLDEVRSWLSLLPSPPGRLSDLRRTRGTLAVESLTADGPLFEPDKWRFEVAGTLADTELDAPLLPGLTTVTGRVLATNQTFTLSDAKLAFLDSTLAGTLSVKGYLGDVTNASASATGTVGPVGAEYFLRGLSDTPAIRPRRPLTISQGLLSWTAGTLGLSGSFAQANGPTVILDLQRDPGGVNVRKLEIRGNQSQAALHGDVRRDDVTVSFSGALTRRTLAALLAHSAWAPASVTGDMFVDLDFDHLIRSRAQGTLRVADVTVPLPAHETLRVEQVALRAKERRIDIESSDLVWGESHLNVHGAVESAGDAVSLDLNVSTPEFDWAQLDRLLAGTPERRSHSRAARPRVPFTGTLRFATGRAVFGPLTWNDLQSTLQFSPGIVDLQLTNGTLCGIDTPGQARLYPHSFEAQLTPTAQQHDLASAIDCLLGGRAMMTGTFTLSGEIAGVGTYGEVLNSLRGPLQLTATDGRIYRLGLLAKILNFLDLSESLTGPIPNLTTDGLAYSSLTLAGDLQDGRFELTDGLLNASAVTLAATGIIDLATGTLDLTVLASPLGMVRPLLSWIPFVSSSAGTSVISVPIRVAGTLDEPKIIPLDPSAVTTHAYDLLKRTVRFPIKLIRPLLPGEPTR